MYHIILAVDIRPVPEGIVTGLYVRPESHVSCSGPAPYMYMYACANAKLEALASDRAIYVYIEGTEAGRVNFFHCRISL